MFGSRRRRAQSNPPLNGLTANPAAATAATSAFLKNRASNVSLSSAAAAAALKARPMTPTSVADVQTKRTLKRTNSTSSAGSGSQRSATPQLERRLSSGSMSERTFRESSPARHVPSAVDAPPVPQIPQDIVRADSHRRTSSLEPPARVSSPLARTQGGRGSSLGPHGSAVPRNPGQRTSLQTVAELTSVNQRRGSVNFSYPTGSRPQSPIQRLTSPSPSRLNPAQTTVNGQSLVYDPNTRSFLPAVEVHAIQQKIADAAYKPAKKKKRPVGVGSHISEGTVGGRPKGTAVDALKAQHQEASHVEPAPITQALPASKPEPEPETITIPVPPPDPVPIPTKQTQATAPRRKKKIVSLSDSEGEGSYANQSSDNDSDTISFSPRRGPQLGKKPSIVREDREREEEEDDTPRRFKSGLVLDTATIDRNVSPTPLPRSKAGRGHGKDSVPNKLPTNVPIAAVAAPAVAAPLSTPIAAPVVTSQRSVSQPPPAMEHIEPVAESGLVTNGSVRGGRVSSLSPGPKAHFAVTPDNLTVKHQPPPRSISPRKSALKHSNSRTSSPMPTHGSETSSPGQDDQILPKKKSVRVSFDETNVVVGEASTPLSTDSPVVQSPQVGKRPWYSLGRGKRKEIVTDDEEDEVMKPRPALPSFGSVRERKNRDVVEERALVKPAEPAPKQAPAISPPIESVGNPLGQSNDHIVGAIFAQDSTSRNAANISKSREPLPPQVLSVEGSGYSSDSDSSISAANTPPTVVSEVSEPAIPEPEIVSPEPEPSVAKEPSPQEDDTPTPTQEHVNGTIPEIAISLPTPTPEETAKKTEWLSVPGSWESTSDSESNETPRVSSEEPPAPTPALARISEPAPDRQIHASPKVEAEHIYSTIAEETEESEADVFSDAAEELTESDEEGFMSLNAAVESPITTVKSTIPNPPESPTSKIAKERAIEKSPLQDNEPGSGGWNQAQEYWSSLSADKRRQAELDALKDDSETETEIKPAPKPKKKKKVVKPDPPQESISSERTYMIQPGSKAGPSGHASYTPLRTSMRTEPPLSAQTSLRKSMRAEPPAAESTMRKSMRGPNQGSMRGSMSGSEPMQKKTRPVSLPVESKPQVQHSRNLSSASAATASNAFKPKPALELRRKNSSDSESSFKRTRPTGESRMRGTMRANSTTEPPQASSRFSIRSLSPTVPTARKAFGGPQSEPTHMRMSMRGSVGAAPTLRGPPGRAKSPSGVKMPSFGFGSKSAKPQKVGRIGSSRFADSSDDEDERPTFRSRFVDSSDESDNEPAPRTRTLGGATLRAPVPPPITPKNTRPVDDDSSDLPDSDDEKSPNSPNLAGKLSKKRQTNGAPVLNGTPQSATNLRRSGSGRGTITTITAPLANRPPHKRRGSIMSILRRKKDDTSKVRKSDAESPARRDTPLERSKSDLLALRNDQPASPKLQKRNPLSRQNTDQASPVGQPFGLGERVPQISGVVNDRPFTADGVNGAEAKEMELTPVSGGKPSLGGRRATSDAIGAIEFEGGVKKKKKFGALRKMFGLHD